MVSSVLFVSESGVFLDSDDIKQYSSKNRNLATREKEIRKQISKMTRAKDNISFVYKETLRAMIASFNDVGYIDAEEKWQEVKCIHANAERAVAKLKQENNIILPILSVSQTVSENSDKRRKYESVLVHEKYWDEDKNRARRIISLAPRAIDIKYTLNIWSKYMADMDQLFQKLIHISHVF